MKTFGKAVTRGTALAVVMALAVGTAWASEFSEKVERIFSPSVIKSINESGTNGEVAFKVPERMPDYFESGDKANKVLAIESVRVFRDVPGLERLKLKVPQGATERVLDVSRADVESYYKVSFSEMNSDPNAWRTKFIQNYDNKESRADFVERFATTSKP